MSDVHALENPLEPVPGIDAFRTESPSSIASRAAQYLGMCAYAFGGNEIASGVQDDGDALEVPHVVAATEDLERWADQSELDALTDIALQHHVGNVSLDEKDLAAAAALWEELSATHLPTTLLALLNLRQRSDDELEAVAAAAGLAIFSRGQLEKSISILEAAAQSEDDLVRGIASAILQAPPSAPQPRMNPMWLGHPTSTTIHGTWGLVTETGWHKPGSPLHDHLRLSTTDNLYDDPGYFIWSGEYSDWARSEGAADLVSWREIISDAGWLDTVYAHSHGGNVALSAAASGQRIKMLVLLHTPAIGRPDEEWVTISGNIGGVIAMRTRMDLVVLADSLRSRENRQKFNPSKLPHFFPVVAHWKGREAWFSHSYYITLDNWIRNDLADIVRSRYALIR